MRRFLPILSVVAVLSLSLSACTLAPSDASWRASFGHDWRIGDLRLLRLPDNVPPGQAMIALYTRSLGSDLQIRIDLLDDPSPDQLDLFLALDTQPGGSDRLPLDATSAIQWDRLLVLPAQGPPYSLTPSQQPDPTLVPRLVRDPDNGFLTVHVNRNNLPGSPDQMQIQAFLAPASSQKVADQTQPVRMDSAPPAPAPLLLAFSDTLPAETPALALRRWDGAHTGPFGGRHGLHELLNAAEDYQIPLTLLDLKTPPSLSALDYLGGGQLVQRMAAGDLLTLPDVAYGNPLAADVSLRISRTAGVDFGLGQSQFLYGSPDGSNAIGYPFRFADLADPNHIQLAGGQKLIPLPLPYAGEAPELQTDPPGIPLGLRQHLLQTALTPDPADLVVLGGSLPPSAWGDSRAVGSAFSFIAAHPWIHVLDASDLAAFPAVRSTGPAAYACAGSGCLASGPQWNPPVPFASLDRQVASELRAAPAGAVTDLAWQSYLMLTAPSADARLDALRLGYLPQVRDLLAVSAWAQSPGPISRCDQDIDGDGQPECLLASDQLFLILRPDGARLLFAFTLSAGQPVELVGPASQFAVGLSDPSDWRPELGLAGDPADIPGGFTATDRAYDPFQPDPSPGKITFIDRVHDVTKTYQLASRQIQFSYQAPHPTELRLPLAVAPQARFTAGWSNLILKDTGSGSAQRFGMLGAPSVYITTDADYRVDSYFDSMRAMGTIEDPNQDYPSGHYLPFPLSVITISAQNQFHLELNIDTQ